MDVNWSVILGELVTQILRVLIPVCAALVLKWAIQVYEEIKKNRPDFALVLQTAVNQAVTAAEQVLQTAEGQEKKEYAIKSVQNYLTQKGMYVDIDIIEDAIEATVYSLNRENFFLPVKRQAAAKEAKEAKETAK